MQGVFQPASVRVLRGWQEGREYPLVKTDNLLGRDERADIALFRGHRASRSGMRSFSANNRFVLVNNHAPPEQTQVNGAAGHLLARFERRRPDSVGRHRTAIPVAAAKAAKKKV